LLDVPVLVEEELSEDVLIEAVLAEVLSIVELDAEGEADALLEANTGLNTVVVEALDEAALISMVFLLDGDKPPSNCLSASFAHFCSKIIPFCGSTPFRHSRPQTPAPPR
jgi:hypothetical protein